MRTVILKILLWVVCVSHLALGVAGLCSPVLTHDVIRIFYGAHLEMTPLIIHILRLLAAYMIGIGLLAAWAALKPAAARPVIVIIAMLLLMSVAHRALFAGEIEQSFGIPPVHLWGQAIYFLALAIALLSLMPRRKPAA